MSMLFALFLPFLQKTIHFFRTNDKEKTSLLAISARRDILLFRYQFLG